MNLTYGYKQNPQTCKPDVVVTGIKNDAWIPVTFQNSWVNFGGGYETAAYTKDAFGNIHIKGSIKGGASGSVAFTLPANYRPLERMVYANYVGSVPGYIEIDAAGNLSITGTDSTTFSSVRTYFKP